jgi:LPXTG-motif cell wall-anchored protein
MSGVHPMRGWRAPTSCLFAVLIAWGALAAPAASAASEPYRLSCSPMTAWEDGTPAIEPGAQVSCHLWLVEPEPPHVLVRLQPSGTAETFALYDGGWAVEWEDHEAWFSFEVPGSARRGDLIVVDVTQAVNDGNARSFVLQIAGETPPSPAPEPPPQEVEEPAPPAEPADGAGERGEAQAASDAIVEPEGPEELPATGDDVTLILTGLGVGSLVLGASWLAAPRRRR